MRRLFLSVCIILLSVLCNGQDDVQRLRQRNRELEAQIDSLRALLESIRAAEPLAEALEEGNDVPAVAPRPMDYSPEITDSLLTLWYRNTWNRDNAAPIPGLDTLRLASAVSDSVMIRRLSAMNPFFTLPFNDVVKNYMVLYSEKRGEVMQQAMALSDYYFPIFEEAFLRYGIPLELKYLAVVESMLKPTATSRAGAKGLWQFMYRTGKAYGLEITSFVDERMDVEKSTDAAARYLRDLYTILGDWPLAISAYNCGAGNVNKAIRRAGGKRDFWSVYPYLPSETRGYMPAFVGVMYAFFYSRDYGLNSVSVASVPSQVDTFEIRRNLHFKQISEVVGVPLSEIEYLNPKYYNGIIPGSAGKCILNLPFEWSAEFMSADRDSLYLHKASEYLSEQVLKDIESGKTSADKGGARIVYTVRSGDTLSHIARRYHTSVKQLKSWNHLRSDRLSIGQKIYIY